MPSVHLRACSFAHTAATPVLDDVTLDLADGWVGVVGANGSGKTTLLHLLAGELSPTAGTCEVVAAVPAVLCRQDVDHLDDAVAAFADDWDGRAAALRSRLDLDPDDLDRWSTLSPGQRKRWQVGAALVGRPDVLLLDEPTNHVDAPTRELLVRELRRFRGLGLVVSHDRDLLASLTTATVRVHQGAVDVHAGSYDEARVRWEAVEAATRDEHDAARREERRLRAVLADVRHDRSGAEHASRAARRRAGANRPDAREAGRKFAQRKAEQKLANRVHQLNRRVDRAAAAVDAVDVGRDLGGAVALAAGEGGQRRVVSLCGDVHHGGGAVLLRGVDVSVARGEHVHVAGPNGAGKSTLVRALVSAAPRPPGWLPQELARDEVEGLTGRLGRLDPDLRGRALGIVANLGVDPDRLLVTDRPSPGEARKLALALLLLEPHDLVVLDEPTNHLDLPAVERLEEAVAAYAGAVLVATHDERFAAATTARRWWVGHGSVQVGP